MTTDHGITLDEQIRLMGDLACEALRREKVYANLGQRTGAMLMREDASMLLTVENTLRAERARTAHCQD